MTDDQISEEEIPVAVLLRKIEVLSYLLHESLNAYHLHCNLMVPDRHLGTSWMTCKEGTCTAAREALAKHNVMFVPVESVEGSPTKH